MKETKEDKLMQAQTDRMGAWESLRERLTAPRRPPYGMALEWIHLDQAGRRLTGSEPGRGRILGRYVDARERKIVVLAGPWN